MKDIESSEKKSKIFTAAPAVDSMTPLEVKVWRAEVKVAHEVPTAHIEVKHRCSFWNFGFWNVRSLLDWEDPTETGQQGPTG